MRVEKNLSLVRHNPQDPREVSRAGLAMITRASLRPGIARQICAREVDPRSTRVSKVRRGSVRYLDKRSLTSMADLIEHWGYPNLSGKLV